MKGKNSMHKKVPKEVKLFAPKLPYPQSLMRKYDLIFQNLMETIREVKVNIPLLTNLKSNLKYNKMIKDPGEHTHMLGDIVHMEKVVVGSHRVVIIEEKFPPKMKNPRSFVLTCNIGEVR